MLRLGQRRAECDRLRGHFARTPVLVTISTSNCCFIVAILFIMLCIFVDFFYWCIFKMIKVDLFSRSKFSLLSFEQTQTFPGVMLNKNYAESVQPFIGHKQPDTQTKYLYCWLSLYVFRLATNV